MKIIRLTLTLICLLGIAFDYGGTGLCSPDASGARPQAEARDAQWERYAAAALEADNKCDYKAAEHLWQQALARCAQFADKDPRLSQTLYYFARFYARWGQYGQAIPMMSRFVTVKKKFYDKEYLGLPWNLAELGDLYYATQNWTSAIAQYKEAIGLWDTYGRWPDEILALDRSANAEMKVGDPTKAEDQYRKALDLSKRSMAMPAIGAHKYFVQCATALVLTDYARLLNSDGRRRDGAVQESDSAQIWRDLSAATAGMKPAAAENTAGKESELSDHLNILGRLEGYYAKFGLYADADNVEDLIRQLKSVALDAKQSGDPAVRKKMLAELNDLHQRCYGSLPSLVVPSWVSEASLPGGGGPAGVAAKGFSNPYLQQFKAIRSRQEYFEKRLIFTQRYAWGIPNEAAIKTIHDCQPILEVGAGAGYWAYLSRQLGTDIVAYDINPVETKKNRWHSFARKSWSNVLSGDESVASRFPNRTLFLCWPPGVNQCALLALARFRGNKVILVGEPSGPCSAPQQFHDLIRKDWELEKQVEIPQWPGIYDSLFVYKKKGRLVSSVSRAD